MPIEEAVPTTINKFLCARINSYDLRGILTEYAAALLGLEDAGGLYWNVEKQAFYKSGELVPTHKNTSKAAALYLAVYELEKDL